MSQMKFVLFVALIFFVYAQSGIAKFIDGDWKFYAVEENIKNDDIQNEQIQNEEDVNSEAPEVPEDEVEQISSTLVSSFNISKRTDIPDVFDLIEVNEDVEKYYQLSMVDDTTIEVTLIGEEEEEDQVMLTLSFYNASNMYIAEGVYEDVQYTAYIPRTSSLLLIVHTYKKDSEGNVVIKRYYGEKAYVDERTFFQKYQMFIMMGGMMLFQMFMGQPQQPQQRQGGQ